MKTKIFLTAFILITASSLIYGQTIQHPWWIVDNGGGKSTGGELTLHTSTGQAVVQRMAHIATGKVLESGYIPGLRNMSGASTTITLDAAIGWNMVSVPLLVNDYRKTILFPTAVSQAYAYDAGYKVKDTLSNGAGYWLKYSSEQAVPIKGTSIMRDSIDVNARWNMIGVVSYPILISEITPIPPVTIQSQYFGYTSTGYYTEDTLKPGSAYWLKVNQAGKIVLKSGSVLLSSSQPVMAKSQNKPDDIKSVAEEKGLRSLILKDVAGREQTLYFTAKPVEIDLEKYELPPIPPSGLFDVRFQSQRNVEVASKERLDRQEYPIKISGAKYPITINWVTNGDCNNEYALEVKFVDKDKIAAKRIILDIEENTLTIEEEALGLNLIMSAKGVVEIPKQYALYQNYPNPFNPTTKIKYDLPVASKVTLKVYNILGQEVVMLVNEMQEPGFKIAELDGTNLSSGVYFYQLVAGDYIAVKRFILMK